MNITKKLIFWFIGITTITLLMTLSLARWSFEQGFNEFLQAQEMQRLERIASIIELELTSSTEPNITLLNQSWLNNLINAHSSRPNRRGPPPPPPMFNENGTIDQNGMPDPTGRPPKRRPENRIDPNNLAIPTAILDAQGQFFAGQLLAESNKDNTFVFKYPIIVDQQTIAILVSWQDQNISSGVASDFAQQQMKRSIFIGVFCLMVASMLGFFVAKAFTKPLHQVINGVEKLSNGDYSHTLHSKRRDEIGQLITHLNFLAHTLEQTRTAKNRWFADISHELRTPLTILRGEIEAMQHGIRKCDAANLQSLLEEALILQRLIDDLYQLSTSDIGALKYDMQVLDLSELVAGYEESTVHQCFDKALTAHFSVTENLLFNGDKTRIKQLVSNLLNNSIKYTDLNGSISVALFTEHNNIMLQIDDSGPGLEVSEIELTKIFEPLYRLEQSRNRKAGGAGLGLAICKNIVQAHQGTIHAEHSSLGGLKIIISFPMEAMHATH